MKKETKVDRYLRCLARELSSLSEEARATVLAEVKAQITKARDQGRSTEDVLAGLGSPKLTAKSYLRPCSEEPRSRWVRWLAIGTVVFFALVFAGGLAVILRLSAMKNAKGDAGLRWWGPTLKVDDSSGHIRPVEALGTPAVVDQANVTGARDLAALGVTKVRLPFNTGKLVLNPAEGTKLGWTCEAPLHEEPRAEVENDVLTLKLDGTDVARCTIDVPAAAKVEVRGTNGHLEINRPVASLDVQLTNGRVGFQPDPGRLYDADVHVKNGLQDFFRRSAKAGATKIKINVTNGTVKKE